MSLAKALATMANTPKPSGARVPENSRTRAPKNSAKLAKRSDPRYMGLKTYVPRELHKRAKRKAEDEGFEDFSDCVEYLIEKFMKEAPDGPALH